MIWGGAKCRRLRGHSGSFPSRRAGHGDGVAAAFVAEGQDDVDFAGGGLAVGKEGE